MVVNVTTDTLLLYCFLPSFSLSPSLPLSPSLSSCHPLPYLSLHLSTASLLHSLAAPLLCILLLFWHARPFNSPPKSICIAPRLLDTVLDFVESSLCARGSSETKLKDGQSAEVLGSLYFSAANLLIALGRNKPR